jgi:DMSO/TMAO reductase YedYZ molybdopterin-dependent catalytic subunit
VNGRFSRALRRSALGAVIGLLAAGVAVGVGEFVAAFVRPQAAPVIAVGNKFILLTPESLKDFAIRHFGSNDKNVLLTGIYVAIALLAIVLGIVALRWLWGGVAALLGFGAVGIWSAATADAAHGTDVVPTVVGTVVGIAALVVLVLAAGGRNTWPIVRADAGSGTAPLSRRTFLGGGVAAVALAAGGGVGGRALQGVRFDAGASRAAVTLPAPASPAPPLPAGVDLHKGAAPFVTRNADFYRVDTAISVPQLETSSWQLAITGMVDHPMTLSFEDLLARPLIERYVTMTCVSNEVGGQYVSTAKFLGARLRDLLRQAGVQPGADAIVGTSSDGMTIGTPTATIMSTPDAMLAVGMNDEPLPLEHGFPVRMLVPGLYGYVSATKWLVQLEATSFAASNTYWVQRGWAPEAPIRLESRIDTPQPFQRVRAGDRIAVAGVAWHQTVGIREVQVRIGGGAWRTARLGRVPSTETWVQWVLPWTVSGSGTQSIEVRAIDRDGQMQTQQRRQPFPSGASGWHTVVVTVT